MCGESSATSGVIHKTDQRDDPQRDECVSAGFDNDDFVIADADSATRTTNAGMSLQSSVVPDLCGQHGPLCLDRAKFRCSWQQIPPKDPETGDRAVRAERYERR